MTTDQRLARVERQCSLFKAGFALVTVALAVVLLIGAGQDQDKPKVLEEVRAKRFVVQDETGRERAVLGMRLDGLPGILLKDKEGKLTRGLVFLLGPETGFEWMPDVIRAKKIILVDALGKQRVVLSTKDDFAPVIVFNDIKEHQRLRLELIHEGLPRLTLDAKHKALIDLEASSANGWFKGILELVDRGYHGLEMYDEHGRTFWKAGVRR